MPSKKNIKQYWTETYNINFDDGYCWGCGFPSLVERAHLHAHCQGGNEECDNLILLCHFCHSYLQEDFAQTKEGAEKVKSMILDGMPFYHFKSNLFIGKVKLGLYDDFIIKNLSCSKEELQEFKQTIRI